LKNNNFLGERKQVKSAFEEFNTGTLLHVVKGTLIWAVLFVFVAFVGARVYLRFAPEIYESHASIMLKSQKETQVLGVGDIMADHRNTIDLEIQLLKSKFLISKALEKLELDVEYYSKGKIKSSQIYTSSPFEADIEVNNENIYESDIYITLLPDKKVRVAYSLNGTKVDDIATLGKTYSNTDFELKISLKEGVLLQNVVNNEYFIRPKRISSVVAEVASKIQITPVNINTRTIKISYRENNPHKAKDIVNAVASTFIDYDKDKKTESINSIIDFLNIQIENFSSEYFNFQDTLKNFRIDMGFVDPSNQIASILTKLQELEKK
jgi:tyrosine-protein kinase Etk/Wzc